MEEVKDVHTVEGCHRTCVDMHKFCPKSCCIIKCLLIVAVLGGVFAAGFAAGCEGEGHDRHEGYGKGEGYRGEQMMLRDNEGSDEAWGWDNSSDGSQNVQVMYRTVSQPVTQQSVATTTPR